MNSSSLWLLVIFQIPISYLFLSGPINREMRHLISTLQTHNQQMKGEVVKYKIRLRETQAELNQVIQMEIKRV